MLHAHLVFVCKYRRHVITPRVFDLIRRSMRRTAGLLGLRLVAIEADGDHRHLMVEYPPQLALSEIVRKLKGTSSRLVRKAQLPEVLRRLWGNAFWSPSYFVVSCGGAPLDVVKVYVEHQQGPERRIRGASRHRTGKKPYLRAEDRSLRAEGS